MKKKNDIQIDSSKTQVNKPSFETWVNNLTNKTDVQVHPSSLVSFIPLAKEMNTILLEASGGAPVVSNAKLIGSGASSAMSADALYVSLRNSGDTVTAQKALAVSPATGCAMCLSLAAEGSGFNPASPAQAGNMSGFLNYINQLYQCPILNNQLNDSPSVSWGSDWNTTITNILSYYVGIAPTDLTEIHNSLWDCARAAASNPNTTQKTDLFVQNTMNIGGDLKVYLYKSFIQMIYVSKGGGKNEPDIRRDETNFKIYRVIFDFDESRWPDYSKTIISKTNASLNSWLNDNSPAQNAKPINWD